MPLDWLKRRLRPQRAAVAAWALLLSITIGQAVFVPKAHTVYPIFQFAGENWRASKPLYRDYRHQYKVDFYRYSPPATPFFAALSVLPLGAAGVLWRTLNAAVLLGALHSWFSNVLPEGLTSRHRGAILLAALPLSAASLHNGQTNPIVLGLLLIMLSASAQSRWWIAATAAVVATVLKIYPISMAMLLAACFPRKFAPKLLMLLAAAAIFPFLTQNPEYVVQQYKEWIFYLSKDLRHKVTIPFSYRDLRFIGLAWGWRMRPAVYSLIQLAGAAAAAAACLAAVLKNWPKKRVLSLILGLGSVWMTLLGPATECCTFIFVAPSLAWAIVESSFEPHSRLARVLILGSLGLFVFDMIFPGGSALPYYATQTFADILLLAGIVQLAIEYEKTRSTLEAARMLTERPAVSGRPKRAFALGPMVGARSTTASMTE